MPSNFAFATFLIVCPTSFFLGILFSLFPYDYPLLWSSNTSPIPLEIHLAQMETHLRLLHASPPLIIRILHTMIFLGGAGLIAKLYKPSESNMLFDGGSLVLYVCGIVVYVANIVKGLRIVTTGVYGPLPSPLGQDDAGGGQTDQTSSDDGRQMVVGREDNLKVLSASNTILALVMVGVLVLQAGQWYAERADERESRKMATQSGDGTAENDEDEDEVSTTGASVVGSSTASRRTGLAADAKRNR